MLLIDEPYLSPFLRETIRRNAIPVVGTPAATKLGVDGFPKVLGEKAAIESIRGEADPRVLLVSESSLGWIAAHLSDIRLHEQVKRLKNKARFRESTRALFPDLCFQEIAFDQLHTLDLERVPPPFILKPTVGFFSLGVRQVDSAADWPATLADLRSEIAGARPIFPTEVLDTSSFLVEQRISGPEFAIDAYYDSKGLPVVLSVLEHRFASARDLSDRIYTTSKEIIKEHLQRFTDFLSDLGPVFQLRNFAVHVEVRLDEHGQPWPIEVNPLRFGGWCTTADLTHSAFGINPYTCFFSEGRPDWKGALRGKDGQLFSIVALGNSTGIEGDRIRSFDYDRLLARFEHPIELRKTDFRRYPIFGFVFTQTRAENRAELDWALASNLREFVTAH